MITNAGLDVYGPLEMIKNSLEYEQIVSVNMLHTVYMAKVFLPQLISRKEKSALITVSSLMSQFYSPGYNMYSNSKKFVTTFHTALTKEIQYDPNTRDKVDIMIYSPGYVATKLSR
jgi:short-subunit dehydrogenase